MDFLCIETDLRSIPDCRKPSDRFAMHKRQMCIIKLILNAPTDVAGPHLSEGLCRFMNRLRKPSGFIFIRRGLSWPYPDNSITLVNGKFSYREFWHGFVVELWSISALPGSAEAKTMKRTLYGVVNQASLAEFRRPMRADIQQRGKCVIGVAKQHDGFSKTFDSNGFVAHVGRKPCGIPSIFDNHKLRTNQSQHIMPEATQPFVDQITQLTVLVV